MKSYLEASLREFLADAGAKQPTPGGGSCAALIGAVGVSLAQMAARYTLAGKKYAEHHAAVNELLAELEKVGQMFRRLMEEDMAAYEAYRDAAKDKTESPETRARYQQAVIVAATVPLEILSAAVASLRTMAEFRDKCSRYLASDLSCAAWAVEAAAHAAAENVRINLPEITDRAKGNALEDQLRQQLTHVEDLRPKITEPRS